MKSKNNVKKGWTNQLTVNGKTEAIVLEICHVRGSGQRHLLATNWNSFFGEQMQIRLAIVAVVCRHHFFFFVIKVRDLLPLSAATSLASESLAINLTITFYHRLDRTHTTPALSPYSTLKIQAYAINLSYSWWWFRASQRRHIMTVLKVT